MDFKTQPTSRANIREIAVTFRRLFGVPLYGPFPVLLVLDKIPDVFKGCYYSVDEDHTFDRGTMAYCTPNNSGGYTIHIRYSVYSDASSNKGAALGFICHEICHLMLFSFGFTPIIGRSFKDSEVEPARSVEWQAKALCGEVMIPYEESIGMNVNDIMEYYHVSKATAEYRFYLKN